jgi:hypothetical protein
MSALHTYDYAYIRVTPRVETEEFLNAGVILFCRTRRFLGVRICLDRARLASLAPETDADEVQRHLDAIERVAGGEGPIGALGQAEIFHWLVAPHSTVIQSSPVHSGLCADPAAALDALAARLIQTA